MTDDLIARLRKEDEWTNQRPYFHAHPKCLEAADRIEALTAEVERLRVALLVYTDYCGICHSRGVILEEDYVTGKDLWRDCPGCSKARAALEGTSDE